MHVLTNNTLKNISRGKKFLAKFLDLAKVFDTVSNPLLIKRLERVGQSHATKILGFYLSIGTQYAMTIRDAMGENLLVSHGISQGSILDLFSSCLCK